MPSADPRNRLLAALRQCEIVLVECQLIPSEEEVVAQRNRFLILRMRLWPSVSFL
jgi:hypothetical protein